MAADVHRALQKAGGDSQAVRLAAPRPSDPRLKNGRVCSVAEFEWREAGVHQALAEYSTDADEQVPYVERTVEGELRDDNGLAKGHQPGVATVNVTVGRATSRPP